MSDSRTSSRQESGDRSMAWNAAITIAVTVAFVGGGVVGWLVGSRRDDSDPTESADDVRLVEEWVEAVRAEDPERISNLYTEDAVWYDDAGDARFTGVTGAYTGWNIFGVIDGVDSVDVIAVGEDHAGVQWTFRLRGDDEITGVSVLELDDGLISAETVYYDSAQAP